MTGTIKITSKINDKFAQYKATILFFDKPVTLQEKTEIVDRKNFATLNIDSEVFINVDAIKQKHLTGNIDCEFLPFLYANNPSKGIVLNLIKIL